MLGVGHRRLKSGRARAALRLLAVGVATIAALLVAVPAVTAAIGGDDPGVTLSSPELAFAARAVGTAADAHAVEITNDGPRPLTIATFRIQGADSDDFAQGADCPVPPRRLPVGASCTVYVTFTPQSPGTKTATRTPARSTCCHSRMSIRRSSTTVDRSRATFAAQPTPLSKAASTPISARCRSPPST